MKDIYWQLILKGFLHLKILHREQGMQLINLAEKLPEISNA